MSDSDSGSDMDIDLAADQAMECLLPVKSKLTYERTFREFSEWCKKKNVLEVNEKSLLVYFNNEIGKKKPNTAWSIYSMLKTTINSNLNIDIRNYNNLKALLKRKSDGYSPNKAKTFSKNEIISFLQTAEDNIWLPVKVALIVGILGCCRKCELMKMDINDIEDKGEFVEIKVPDTKNKKERLFVITEGNFPNVNLLGIFRSYANKRVPNTNHSRFFVGMRNGKCTKQPIGINTIAGYPKKIATFLKLKNVDLYTGHCFRRTSASLLADSGVGISIIQRHGGWKSATVAEGYVETSVQNKKNIAGMIVGEQSSASTMGEQNPGRIVGEQIPVGNNLNSISSTSMETSLQNDMEKETTFNATQISISNVNVTPVASAAISDFPQNPNKFHISGSTNCTFNFYK